MRELVGHEKRKCTDLLFVLLFSLFWIGMLTISIIAFDGGDPRLLYYPQDSFNHTCGISRHFQNRTKLSFPAANLPIPDYTTQICVSACPQSGNYADPLWCAAADAAGIIPSTDVVCNYNVVESGLSSRVQNNMLVASPSYDGNVTGYSCYCSYPTTSLLLRCLPTSVANVSAAATEIQNSFTSRSTLEQVFSDVEKSLTYIFGLSLLSLIVCFIWLVLISIFCKLFVWLTVLAFLVMMVASCAYLWNWTENNLQSATDTATTEVDSSYNVNKTVRILTYIWTVLTILAIVMVISLRKRISLAIEIIREASKAVESMPMIVFFPIVSFVVMTIFLVYWVFMAMYLASFSVDATFTQSDLNFMQTYWAFGFLWNTQFIVACNTAALGGSFAAWYWKRDKKLVESRIVFKMLWTMLRFHLGSLAFGALIVAVVEFVRGIITWIQSQLEVQDQTNRIIQCIFCIFQCCFSCVERFLLFINRNAYIMIAVHGDNFCSATRRSFSLLLSNAIRAATLNVVSDYVLWLAKVTITLFISVIATSLISSEPTVSYWLFPVLIIGFFSFCITSVFFLVFEVAIDAIFICYLDEIELSKDNPNYGALYCSDELAAFVKSNYSHQQHKKPLLS